MIERGADAETLDRVAEKIEGMRKNCRSSKVGKDSEESRSERLEGIGGEFERNSDARKLEPRDTGTGENRLGKH